MAPELFSPSTVASAAILEVVWYDSTRKGVERLRTANRGLSDEMGYFKGKNSPG